MSDTLTHKSSPNQQTWRKFIADTKASEPLENPDIKNSWLSELSSWDLVRAEGEDLRPAVVDPLCGVDR